MKNTYPKYFVVLIALTLFGSCKKQVKPANISSLPPKYVQPKGFVVPQDSIQLPIIVPLHNQKIVKVGKPTVYADKVETHQFSPFKKINFGKPTVNVAGQNGFLVPQQISTNPIIIKAGIPEKIIAKSPVFKEQNSKNIGTFGLSHGLLNHNISKTVQDTLGNLWIATGFGGVSKYDGKTFSNYTEKEGLVNNTILDMILDHAGNLWLGTYHGVSMFDGVNFVNYTTDEGLLNNVILQILEDSKHNIWIFTEKGVSRLDVQHKILTNFTEKNGLSFNFAMRGLEDVNGNIWIGTFEHGVSVLSTEQNANHEIFTFKNFTTKQGLVGNDILSFREDKHHNIWIGTTEGVSKYIVKENYLLNITKENGLNDVEINTILETKKGEIYLGTQSGIMIIDSENLSSYTSLNLQDGLPDKHILSLFEDNIGTIWIGTEAGLGKYRANNFSFLNIKDSDLLNITFAILEDKKNNVWLGTQNGVFKYVRNKNGLGGFFYQYSIKQGLSDDFVYSLFEDKAGNIWIGTRYGGVTKYNPLNETFTHFSEEQGLKSKFVTSMLQDEKGDIWFGMLGDLNGGVSKFDGKTFTNFGQSQGLVGRDVWSIAKDKKGNFWIGSWGEGITKFEPNVEGQKRKFTHFKKATGLSSDKIRPIKIDKNGDVWIGTLGGGLYKYHEPSDGKSATFTHYTNQDGLSSDDIRSIFEDTNEDLWFGNYYGLSKLLTTKTTNNKPFKSYTNDEGFLGVGSFVNAMAQTKDNKIWIGTLKKITIFDPSKINKKSPSFEIQLSEIKLFNEKTTWAKNTNYILKNGVKVGDFKWKSLSKLYNIPAELSLPHNNNFITFDFVGININTPQTLKYQYFLEGLDQQNWSAMSNGSEATYGNLPDGNYTLKIRAINDDGQLSKELDYQFTIRPAWWQTWWAYLIYLCAFVTSIFYFIQFRVQSKLQKFKELEALRINISSNLHDDVGTILSGLAMQSEMLALTTNKPQKASLYEIRDMSHDAMERMRDTVWAIDSRKDKYENLIDRMRAFTEKNLNLKHIKHTFKIEIEDPKKFIDPEKRQNIYLILKEAITNICKHSDASQVKILLRNQNSHFYLVIQDDGKKPSKSNSDGTGLINMQMRAKRIGAVLSIDKSNGFRITLEMEGNDNKMF